MGLLLRLPFQFRQEMALGGVLIYFNRLLVWSSPQEVGSLKNKCYTPTIALVSHASGTQDEHSGMR